jgi:hypothetical protein
MRGSLLVLVVATVLGGSSGVSAQDAEGATAIELADRGFLECAYPDVRRKTCRSIGSYERIREGIYGNTTLMAVGQGVTLEIYMPAWLIDDAFCGSIREQDVMAAIVRVRGREVAPQLAAPALEQAVKRLGPLIDQEVCASYEPSGANFIGKATIGGIYQPERDTPVKMISPSDGYRLAD